LRKNTVNICCPKAKWVELLLLNIIISRQPQPLQLPRLVKKGNNNREVETISLMRKTMTKDIEVEVKTPAQSMVVTERRDKTKNWLRTQTKGREMMTCSRAEKNHTPTSTMNTAITEQRVFSEYPRHSMPPASMKTVTSLNNIAESPMTTITTDMNTNKKWPV